jgi:hypothetical protein
MNAPARNVDRAVGGSCLFGILGGVLGVLIGGFLEGLRHPEPDVSALFASFAHPSAIV